MKYLTETTEQQRVRLYQFGWNDAQAGRAPRANQPLMYTIGFVEAKRGAVNRFEQHEIAEEI